MKKIFLLVILLVSLLGYSQNGISYQALILNPSGEELPGVNNANAPLSNKLICLKFSIIDSNATIEYLETHTVSTDAHGIVNLIIGTGDQIGGYATSFGNIVWNNTPKNLKVELDVRANCTYFVEISNQPFTYVPFAYYAANANVANATTLSTGIIQLAGDLGGTGTTATAPIISNNAITSAKISNGAVTPIKIASGANNTVLVTDATGNVAWVDRASFGAVADMTTIEGAGTTASPFKVKDLGIVTNKIADLAVTNTKLAADAVTTDKILDGEVQTADIKNLNVTTPKLADAAVTPTKIASGSNNTVLVTDATGNVAWVDRSSFGAVADMTTIEGAGTTADPFKVKDLGIITAKLANSSVTTPKLADAAVTTTKIASGSNNTVLVTDATGNVAWLDRSSFGAVADMTTIEGAGTTASPFKVKDLGIVTNKIADLAVTNAKLASDAVTTDKILDGEVQTADIKNLNITTPKLADAAVTPTKIQAGSNDSVLVTDATGAVAWLDKGAFGAVADLTSIEGAGTTADPFKVKDLGIITDKLANGAVTTVKLADDAVTNAKIGEIISVENGGTGSNMTTTAGYVKQATTGANLSTVSTIPVTDVTGAVRSVNGVVPASNGNVAVIIGRVFTGATVDPNLATSIISASPPKQSSDIYIVADGSNPNNGRTFIYDGTNWLEVATDLSTTDARYVNVAGDTMEGDLIVPTGTKIIINDAPLGSTDAVNKAYVDNLITTSATPDATTSIKGKIKLAGDLGGTADAPTVPDLVLKAPLESPSLTGTPLAPTAASGTNTTQIATTAFVTAATSGMQDAITLTTTGTGAASLVGSTLNIPTPNNGTVTEVSALTIGTSGTDITSTVATGTTTPVITLNVPTASAANRGALSAADWTTFNDKIGGTGTINYVPKFSTTKTLTNSSIFDDGTKVGIGTASPANTLEIKQGTSGNSGLRFTNLNSSSTATTTASKVLGLNSAGDVILTNVPGTQNIVAFSTTNPNSGSPTFTPAQPTDQSVIYQSSVDNSMWTYNGTTYVTYSPPAVTAWNLANTTNDAGSNKTSGIWRNGSIGIGTNNPTTNLDVVGGFSLRNTSGAAGSNYAIEFNTNANSPRIDWVYNGSYTGSFAGDADFFFRLQNSKLGSGGFRFMTNPSGTAVERMTILNNGNIGIGTTAPSTKLHIQGNQATLGANASATMLRMSRPTWSGFKWGSAAQFNLGTYDDGVNPVNSKSRLDLVLANVDEALSTTPTMTWLGNGNVGINNTAPSAPLVVQGVTGTGSLKLIAPSVASGDNWWLGFGHGTTSTDANDRARIGTDIVSGGAGRLFFTTGAPGSQTRAMFIDQNQRVGIGTSNPTSTLEVNGSATNTVAYNSGSATAILFNNSNLAYTSASPTSFFLQGIKDGGTYTLAVQGTTSGTASFTAVGFTFKSINNGTTIAGKDTLYTFVVMGTTVYVYMATGF